MEGRKKSKEVEGRAMRRREAVGRSEHGRIG